MGRIKFHATYDNEAQYRTTWRRGVVRVVIYGFSDDPDQMDWAEDFSQRILGAFKDARTLLCTGGDQTETGREWGILIGMGDESEDEVEADGFWPLADDWLEDGNPNDWRRLKEEYRREWEERLEALNDTDDAHGDYGVEVDDLRVWEK